MTMLTDKILFKVKLYKYRLPIYIVIILCLVPIITLIMIDLITQTNNNRSLIIVSMSLSAITIDLIVIVSMRKYHNNCTTCAYFLSKPTLMYHRVRVQPKLTTGYCAATKTMIKMSEEHDYRAPIMCKKHIDIRINEDFNDNIFKETMQELTAEQYIISKPW